MYDLHIYIDIKYYMFLINNMRKCIIFFSKQHLTISPAEVFVSVVTGYMFQMSTA